MISMVEIRAKGDGQVVVNKKVVETVRDEPSSQHPLLWHRLPPAVLLTGGSDLLIRESTEHRRLHLSPLRLQSLERLSLVLSRNRRLHAASTKPAAKCSTGGLCHGQYDCGHCIGGLARCAA